MKTASALSSHRLLTAALLCMMLLLTVSAQAQRPSIADLIAQINAQGNDTTTPEGQVRTALDLLPAFQDAVVGYFNLSGEAPADRVQAGLTASATDTSTNYITAVEIVNGTIIFTFGNSADASIAGEIMTFTPYESHDLTVSWRCGGDDSFPNWFNLLGTTSGGQSAQYVAPTIPESTYPDPCIVSPNPANDQSEVIRAQVRSVLDILPVYQQAVAEYFRARGETPADRDDAGLTGDATDTSTNYIQSIDIWNGTIVVEYGNEANAVIQGEVMTFTPYESDDQTIVWRCGHDPVPSYTQLLGTSGGGQTATYIAPSAGLLPRYQPQPCILRTQPNGIDEVIRAQVLEAFAVVETFKQVVEDVGVTLGTTLEPVPPVNRLEAGLTQYPDDTVGNYFDSVDIIDGVIVVTYGNEANNNIAGEILSFTPYESVDGTIVWRCGSAPYPFGTSLMGTAAGGTTAAYIAPSYGMYDRYLPYECRP